MQTCHGEVVLTGYSRYFYSFAFLLGDCAVRTYLEALEPGNSEFTIPLEYKLFMPYGSYKIETKDESWIMRSADPIGRNARALL